MAGSPWPWGLASVRIPCQRIALCSPSVSVLSPFPPSLLRVTCGTKSCFGGSQRPVPGSNNRHLLSSPVITERWRFLPSRTLLNKFSDLSDCLGLRITRPNRFQSTHRLETVNLWTYLDLWLGVSNLWTYFDLCWLEETQTRIKSKHIVYGVSNLYIKNDLYKHEGHVGLSLSNTNQVILFICCS